MGKRKVLRLSYSRLFLVLFVFIVILIFIWMNFFLFKKCENRVCFDSNLRDCEKAIFISDEEMVFEYKILGREKDNCIVNVRLLRGDLSNQDSLNLENREMKCYVPYGVVIAPESDIEDCHGSLKEGLQDLIIDRLHRYLVQNLGKIHADALGLSGNLSGQ